MSSVIVAICGMTWKCTALGFGMCAALVKKNTLIKKTVIPVARYSPS